MPLHRLLCAAGAVCAALLPGAALPAPRVVTDLLPVQSIVAAVMDGVGAPEALLPPGASPHSYALRPSEARTLQDADLVFWIGPALSPWLEQPITALASGATVISLVDAEGAVLLDYREAFEPATAEAEAGEHDHEHDHDHDHHGIDPHLWLDPVNATAIAQAAAAALATADPANAARYEANAEAFAAEIAALQAEIAARLQPLAGRPFVVFHDGFQYFERRFGLTSAGAISLGDSDRPSAAQVAAIRDLVRDRGITCVLAEPLYEPRLVATVIEGTPARAGSLDPLGAGLPPGPDLYPALLAGLAVGFADCLGG